MTPHPDDVTAGARAMELLPCPFCGEAPKLDSRFHNIECASNNCGTNPEGGCHENDDSAISAWNTRAALAAMPDHSAELVEALERAATHLEGSEWSWEAEMAEDFRRLIANARARKVGA